MSAGSLALAAAEGVLVRDVGGWAWGVNRAMPRVV